MGERLMKVDDFDGAPYWMVGTDEDSARQSFGPNCKIEHWIAWPYKDPWEEPPPIDVPRIGE